MPGRFGGGRSLGFLAFGAVGGAGRARKQCRAVRPALIEWLETRVLMSRSWIVATSGSDGGDGTLDNPLGTIQEAANLAAWGDTVLIRGGTYHETVQPASGGVTFEPYNGESVTISGADPVTGWSNYDGSIYQASIPSDLGDGNNQVFVDGQMVSEARWPNAGPDVSRPAEAQIGSYSNGVIYDPSLTQDYGYWYGATIHITPGAAWTSYSGTVTDGGPGWLQVSLPTLSSFETPTAGNHYYLSGNFQTLNGPGQWFVDSSGNLYLWTPGSDDPGGHDVEVKQRQYAFDLSGVSNTTIEGINLFAAAIHTDSGSSNTTIDRVGARYITQFADESDGWFPPGPDGIELNGNGSVFENSTIASSAGDGVYIGGDNVSVLNNTFHDIDYSGTDAAGVRSYGTNALIRSNTIYNAGRDGINFRQGGVNILGNTIHDVMLQTADGGGIYTFSTDGQGDAIAYNTIYNVTPTSTVSWADGAGIMLDNDSHNYVVHDNTTWNVDAGLKLNYTSLNETVYGNKLAANKSAIETNGWVGFAYDWSGSQFHDNVYYNPNVMMGLNVVQWGNTFATGSPVPTPLPSPPALLPGDIDGDGKVDFADLVLLARNYGKTSLPPYTGGDLNGDGVVNFQDLVILARNYGKKSDQSTR